MEKMTDLKDLLKHEIKDLYSAEEQIIEAIPRMIEKADNPQLKHELERHLRITENQLKRLSQVQQLLVQGTGQESGSVQGGGLFARLMKRRTQGGTGGEKCLGMEGLLKEGEKVIAEDMEASVMDAAIIACVQKVEHYEICSYGTARAYARELNLGKVAELLEQTLDEENEADDKLTDLAVGRVNKKAEMGGTRRTATSRRSASSSAGRGRRRPTVSKSTLSSRIGGALAASSGRSTSSTGRSSSASNRTSTAGRGTSSSGRSASRSKATTKAPNSRSSSSAPSGRNSSERSTSKSSGRGTSASSTRTASASRSAKAPSKAAVAKGGRSSSNERATAKRTGRSSSNGRSSGRR